MKTFKKRTWTFKDGSKVTVLGNKHEPVTAKTMILNSKTYLKKDMTSLFIEYINGKTVTFPLNVPKPTLD